MASENTMRKNNAKLHRTGISFSRFQLVNFNVGLKN
jgi:hypothetical protein